MLESELHKLLEGTADAAFVVDAHGVTHSWNRAAEKLFGYTAAEAVGRGCMELIDGHGPGGTLFCREECRLFQLLATGGEIPDYDLEVKARSGCRVWVNVSILQLHDVRTHQHYAVHLMRDIRQRKKIEELGEKLAQTAKELAALSGDHLPHGPVSPLTDQEQKILRSLAKGRSPAETAAKLKIASRTLRNHLYHVNRKLGTTSRLAAVVHATKRGLI
jgi:PAS domain S-box-containing protein